MAKWLPPTQQVVTTVYVGVEKVSETHVDVTTWTQETVALPSNHGGSYWVQDVIKYEVISPARQVPYDEWVNAQR